MEVLVLKHGYENSKVSLLEGCKRTSKKRRAVGCNKQQKRNKEAKQWRRGLASWDSKGNRYLEGERGRKILAERNLGEEGETKGRVKWSGVLM